MSRALLYLPGRDQIYARVLRQFSESYRAGLPGLDDALQAAGWTEARRLLHALRGACGAVGATELMAQALTLERQLEAIELPGSQQVSGTSPIESAAALQRALSGMARLIDQQFAGMASAPSPAAALTPDALAAMDTAMVELAGLLEVADFRAASRFRALEPTLSTGFGEEAARNVGRPLQLHDYDAALAALQALQAQRRPGTAQPQ